MAKRAAAIAEPQDSSPRLSESSDAAFVAASESSAQSPPPEGTKKSSAKLDWVQAIQQGNDELTKELVASEVSRIVGSHSLAPRYEVLFLFDDDAISPYHSDRLYASASACKGSDRDVLLILHSGGGSIESAYLASKTLKRMCHNKFSVVVPRRAKSAATLLSLGADEIHMGVMSQLGPIDPQIGGLPALALTNAFNFIIDRVSECPSASDMLAMYIDKQVPIRHLGYFQRVGESAIQYAERLLAGKTLAPQQTAEGIANHLVNYYKDHGFVIDFDEAKQLLGDEFVKHETPEYKLGDELYRYIDLVGLFLRAYGGKECSYVGAIDNGFDIRMRPAEG